MEDETTVAQTSEEQTETEVAQDTEVEETVEELRAKLVKAEEEKTNQRIRAEKAEKLAKEKKPEHKSDNLSDKDLIAIVRNNVHDDDIDEVKLQAKARGITVSEALASPEVKAVISYKEELRKSAGATVTTGARRPSSAPSTEKVLADFAKGVIPEQGSPEAELLWKARRPN